MKTRRMTIGLVVLVTIAVLGVAWFDGGRAEQRMIVEPVVTSGDQP